MTPGSLEFSDWSGVGPGQGRGLSGDIRHQGNLSSLCGLSGHCGKLVSSLLSSFVDSLNLTWGFPGGSDGNESACNAGDLGSIPGFGRCPGEGNGCPLQYSCLENSVDRRAWQATVHGVSQSDMTEHNWDPWESDHTRSKS